MPRSIVVQANIILSFGGKDQQFYNAPVILTLPAEDLDAFEVETVRQVLAPVPNDELQDLVKISLCYSGKGTECGKPIAIFEDPEINAAMDHLIRHDAKYYFLPSQRDDYEQRIVDALGIASEAFAFA